MIRRTSLRLIEEAVREKWIRQLAFFHLLKFRFNNSVVYNYKSRMKEIAKLFNISERTFYRYIKLLRAKGLVYEHSNNLILKSLKGGRIKSSLYINDDLILNDLICLLYLKLIERAARNQAFAESIRRFGRGDRLISRSSENPFQPSLSFRTLAKILNCSEFKAFQVTKNLVSLGFIKIKKQRPQFIKDCTPEFLSHIEDYPGYRFVGKNNGVFEVFGCKIEFSHFPIYLKAISVKRVIQYRKYTICL